MPAPPMIVMTPRMPSHVMVSIMLRAQRYEWVPPSHIRRKDFPIRTFGQTWVGLDRPFRSLVTG